MFVRSSGTDADAATGTEDVGESQAWLIDVVPETRTPSRVAEMILNATGGRMRMRKNDATFTFVGIRRILIEISKRLQAMGYEIREF